MFFPSILFFPFVVLFYSLFCCPLYCLSFVRSFGWLPFQEKGKEYQVNSKIPHMLIACLCNSVSIGQNLQLILHFFFIINEKLNGSMTETVHGSKRTKNPKQSSKTKNSPELTLDLTFTVKINSQF